MSLHYAYRRACGMPTVGTLVPIVRPMHHLLLGYSRDAFEVCCVAQMVTTAPSAMNYSTCPCAPTDGLPMSLRLACRMACLAPMSLEMACRKALSSIHFHSCIAQVLTTAPSAMNYPLCGV